MITEGPLPHLVQGRPVALQVCGENADADHVAEPAARRSQDGLQVGEELLGLGFSGVREVPRPRIQPEKCGHENPSVHLDCLGNRALVRRSIGGFDRSHVQTLARIVLGEAAVVPASGKMGRTATSPASDG